MTRDFNYLTDRGIRMGFKYDKLRYNVECWYKEQLKLKKYAQTKGSKNKCWW